MKTPKRSQVPRSNTISQFNRSSTIIAITILALAIVISTPSTPPKLFNSLFGPTLPLHLRPFQGPKLTSLPQFTQKSHLLKFLWGTYRPGIYFGVRARVPQSLLFGLMWTNPTRPDALDKLRHQAQQSDGLQRYGWLAHDGQRYGKQELLDGPYNITTSWVKTSEHGNAWSARVAVSSTPTEFSSSRHNTHAAQPKDGPYISLFFYFMNEDVRRHIHLGDNAPRSTRHPTKEDSKVGSLGSLQGSLPSPIGPWTVDIALHIRVNDSSVDGLDGSEVVDRRVMARSTPHTHNLTEFVTASLIESMYEQMDRGKTNYALALPEVVDTGSNLVVMQISGKVPFAVDIAFLAEHNGQHEGHTKKKDLDSADGALGTESDLVERSARLVQGQELDALLADAQASFDTKFNTLFPASVDGTVHADDQASNTTAAPERLLRVSKAALSNLLGGIGYWYGHSLAYNIKESNKKERETRAIVPLWDAPLFSATPSRSFFPRGFLWDEGFHQLLIHAWNPSLSRDILAHWLDLMTHTGWIPREQILGEESRSRVPMEFVVQSPDAANPPTLFLVLADMARGIAVHATTNDRGHGGGGGSSDAKDFLVAAWPRLQRWFAWYNTTQSGPLPGSYRWRGRDMHAAKELNPKTLTSGLDDYPRASHPTRDERHVDLRCWMALAARAMEVIGSNTDGIHQRDVERFRFTAERLARYDELQKLHWDAANGIFADYGLHTEDVELREQRGDQQRDAADQGGRMERELVPGGRTPVLQYVPQYGYVSLFPLIMHLIPDDAPELGQQLSLLKQESLLWTSHGLRSLSKESSLYQQRNTEHDPPYWRGAVWINMNYLTLKSLLEYEKGGGKYAPLAGKIAKELREALLSTVVGQYENKGYVFEQYDDETGEGKGSHPFTGWTALITLMMM